MGIKNFKVKNGLTVGTGSTIYGNGNIDVAGIITAATFKGDGSGLINVTALGTGIQINNNGSIIGIGSIINFGTNIAVSPVFAGITTITGSTNPIPGISTTGTSFFNELQVGAAATFSGEVEVADYIRHKGDTNTAIRFPTDDTFSVVTGSLERFRVESDGEIGIGTEDPRAKLDVDGTIYSAGNIKLYDNVKAQFGDSQDLSIYHTGAHSFIEDTGQGNLVIKGSRVDIQDTSGNELLSTEGGQYVRLNYGANERLITTASGVIVTGILTATGAVDFDSTLNVDGVSTFNSTVKVSDKIERLGDADTSIRFPGADTFTVETGGTERLRITSAGKVGIGTDNPTNNLTIKGVHDGNTTTSNEFPCLNIANTLHSYTGNNIIGGITFTRKSGNADGIRAGILALYAESDPFGASIKPAADLVFLTSTVTAPTGLERMRITDSGDVSIGSSITVGGISKFNGNVGIASALLDKDGDKGNSGQVLSSTGSQVNWINVGNISAGAASSIAISANNTTNETVYPIFTDGDSGNRAAEVDTGLTYNPSTGVLTATQFTGALSGNAGSATQLQTARNIGGVSFNGTANIDLPGVNTAGNQNTSGTAAGLSGTPDIIVDQITTTNINVSGATTTGAVNWGGHMLPTSNASYDIGSAELKVRHLFLSDNSLRFVDSSDTEHPLSLDNGNLKFGKGLFLGTTIKADAASGIVTATTFKGALDGNAGTATVATNAQGLTGTPNITVGVLNASSGTVSGNLNVQGTLTYVNVDNVTSTGIGTFKKGVQIHADGLDVVGIATFGTGIGVTGNITVTGNVDGRDIAADGTKLDTIATSANNYTHPNHSGEVTSTGDGATLISSNVVDEDNLKISNTGTDGQFLQKQSGNTGGLTWATVDLYEWTLGGDGTNYTFTGPGLDGTVNDPELHLIRGQTYRFINNSGGHPFRIQSTVNGSAGTKYDDGVTNQDAGNGVTLTFEVPQDAPNRLYYQCTAHGSMGGIINIGGGGVSDTATNGETVQAISSNWAFDHNAGTGNLKHVPAAGSSGQFLKHDGTWGTPPNTTYSLVDTSDNGLAPQLPAAHGGKFLKADATWEVPPNTEYGLVSTSADGLAPQLPASHGGKFLKADGSWEVPAYITNTNDYVNSLSFATGSGVLTLGRTGSLADLTVNLDGRYLQSHGLTFGAGLQLNGNAVSSTAAREQEVTWTAVVGTAYDIWTVAHNTADTFEITIYAKNGSHKQVQKMLVMHDGTTAHHNQYAVMHTSTSRLFDFSATISGTNLKIKATPLTGADTSTNGSTVYWRREVLGNSGN